LIGSQYSLPAGLPCLDRLSHPPLKASPDTGERSPVFSRDAITQTIKGVKTGEDRSLRSLEPEPSLLLHPSFDLSPPNPQRRSFGGEEKEIINIAHIKGHTELPLDEMVKRVEIEMGGPKLTGAAHREPSSSGGPLR